MTQTEDTGLLWAGEFGDEYIKRNSELPPRDKFWNMIVHRFRPIQSVLEVGCNIGHNLRYLKKADHHIGLTGCDVNEVALAIARAQYPGIFLDKADIRDLPYEDHSFDMVVSIGVLIHLTNDKDLEAGIKEMFRVSKRWVLISEYWNPVFTMIEYHGYSNALRKGPFDRFVEKTIPETDCFGAGPMDSRYGFDWGMHWWVYSA